MANKDKLKMVTGILLIFFSGIATGHFGTVYYFQNKFYNQGPPPLHLLIGKRISRELRLTNAQQVKFDEILSTAEKNFNTFRKKHSPEIETILTDCFKQINGILTPEQQKKFNRIKNRLKRRPHSPGDRPPGKNFSNRFLPSADFLKKRLDLSQDQVTNIRPILQNYNRSLDSRGPGDPMPDAPDGIPLEKPGALPDHFSDDPGRAMPPPTPPRGDAFGRDKETLLKQLRPFLNDTQMKKLKALFNDRFPMHEE